eukprot:5703428-Pleurochrysis_carterae.AAC.1
METQLASSVAYEDDYSKEDTSDMVLHEPQLQALQALEQWRDNFSAHLLPSREDTHEEEAGSSGDWDVSSTCTASSYDTASTTPGLLCMPCGMGKTVILSHFLRTSNKFNGHFSSSVVILVSPFRVQAAQLLRRVAPFLPLHSPIIVDSDSASHDYIRNARVITTTDNE